MFIIMLQTAKKSPDKLFRGIQFLAGCHAPSQLNTCVTKFHEINF
jgi:hypothetical protein